MRDCKGFEILKPKGLIVSIGATNTLQMRSDLANGNSMMEGRERQKKTKVFGTL